MDVLWVSATDGSSSMINAMGKIEALNQLCLKQWKEKNAPRQPKQKCPRTPPAALTKVREHEVVGVLPIEVQHVRDKHFRVLCVCGPDAAAIVRLFAHTFPSNGRIINKSACEALSVGVASACDNDQNFAAESSFAVPDLTTKASGDGNFNGGQTIADVERRLTHRVLHAGIILHDAFWTRSANAAQRERGSQIGFGEGGIPPFLVYQNRCKNAADLTDGPGFGHVGKAVGDKICKSAQHWSRVWQRKANHVALAAAVPESTILTSWAAADDDAASEASTVAAPLTPPEPAPCPPRQSLSPRGDLPETVASNVLVAAAGAGARTPPPVVVANNHQPRLYAHPAHLKRLWECCSQLDGGFGRSGSAPIDISRGARSRRWARPTEAFFHAAPWRTACIAA